MIMNTAENVIELSEEYLLANKGRRDIYYFPGDATKCIKISPREKLEDRRRRASTLIRKARPLVFFDENRQDQKYYKFIDRTRQDVFFEHLPRFYGTIDTNLGKGSVMEVIRNCDGSCALNLHAYIKKNGVSEELERALQEVVSFMKDNLMLARDLSLKNLVVQEREGGKLHLYIVDGFGDSDFQLIGALSLKLTRKKVIRRLSKLVLRMQKHYPDHFVQLQV